ncbi:MAG: heavy metal-associated domain-containing protein [Candidatus Woesearchaeota archaeon]
MKTTILKIKGMHCRSCEMLIKDALEDEKGVKSANVSLKDCTATIEHDETVIDEPALKRVIKAEGFEV